MIWNNFLNDAINWISDTLLNIVRLINNLILYLDDSYTDHK